MTSDQGTIQGVDHARVTAWFEANIEGCRGPLEFAFISGGHSNLTYGVTDANGDRFVFRRPPLGQVLASAHDMGREQRIIAAVGQTDVPVPPTVGFCDDLAVNGAPFYVMRFVDGHVIRTVEQATGLLTADQRRRAGESIADVLADIHAIDPGTIGLGELSRKDGYIARQLKRWYGQFQQSNERTGRAVPLIHEVHDLLAARIPEQHGTALVHGDYRIDNCMLGDDGAVNAVLDWELCTLGDPLADVGLLLVYWSEAGDSLHAMPTAPTAVEGFPTRADLLDRYAKRSGRDLAEIDFYVAFGYWRLACIIEGVYARYAGGAMGDAAGFQTFERQVVQLAESAKEAADRLP